MSRSSDFGLQGNLPTSKVSEFPPKLNNHWYVLKHEYFLLTVSLVLINHQLWNLRQKAAAISLSKEVCHLPIIDEPYLDNHTTPLIAQFLPVQNGN